MKESPFLWMSGPKFAVDNKGSISGLPFSFGIYQSWFYGYYLIVGVTPASF